MIVHEVLVVGSTEHSNLQPKTKGDTGKISVLIR